MVPHLKKMRCMCKRGFGFIKECVLHKFQFSELQLSDQLPVIREDNELVMRA
jgi:hypothetical protein